MAVVKLSMIIQVATGDANANAAAIRLGGWTENWYDDVPLTNEGVKRQFRILCQKRAALLPNTGVITGQRYQSIDPAGPAAIELMRFPGNSGACDYPSLALLCRVSGVGVVNTRPMYIRGIPDDEITKGEFTPTLPYKAKLDAFCKELQNWNFKAQQLGGVQVPIIGIESDGTVTTAEELTGVALRSRVQVLRTNVALTGKAVGGKFYVGTYTNAFTFKLTGWTAGESSGGMIRLANYIYPTIGADAVTVGRIVTKKVGRPPEQFRGRRSKRR